MAKNGQVWSKCGLQVVSREEALSRIQKQNEPYKIELLEAIPKGERKLSPSLSFHAAWLSEQVTRVDRVAGEDISIYHIGNEWWDLCAGPHVESTGDTNQNSFAMKQLKCSLN